MKKTKYYFYLAGAVFFWCSAFVVSKVALTDFGPLTLSVLRIFLGFLILWPMARKHGFHLKDLFHKNSFIYGIFGYGGNLMLLTLGLTGCTAGMSSIIHGLFPVFMAVFGFLILSETIKKGKLLSIILSLAGVGVASVPDLIAGQKAAAASGNTLWGMALIALSVIIWAFYSVFSKKTAQHIHPTVLTQLFFGTSTLCFAPLAVIETVFFTGFSIPSPTGVISLLYLCLLSGIVGSSLWNAGIKGVSATVSGVYFNLTPVIGLIIAIAYGEAFSWLQLAGGLLIIGGVYAGTKGENNLDT